MNLAAERLLALVLLAGLSAVAVAEPTIKPQPELAAALAAAKKLEFETLADGPDTSQEGPLWWVPNPDGKTWDIVFLYSKRYPGPHEVFAFDTATKELKKFDMPGPPEHSNNFHLVPYLLIGGFTSLAGDKEAQKRTGFSTIDPVTLKGEFLGTVGPENPNLFWEYGNSVMDGDWIYARVGNSPWRLFGMNVKTKQGKVITETERIMGDQKTITFNTNPDYPGVYVTITALKGDPLATRRSFWLRDGELSPCDPIQNGRELIPPWQGDKRAAPRPDFWGRMGEASNLPPGIQFRREPYKPDGFVWTHMGDALVRIDPQTAEVHPVGKMEQTQLLFHDGDIDAAGGLQFRRITGIPKVETVTQ